MNNFSISKSVQMCLDAWREMVLSKFELYFLTKLTLYMKICWEIISHKIELIGFKVKDVVSERHSIFLSIFIGLYFHI